MYSFIQDYRSLSINTPLGKDVLLLAGLQGTEGISQLFNFELELLSKNHSLNFEDIVGKNVTLSIRLTNGLSHFFNGLISRFTQVNAGEEGENGELSSYRATMVPWLWLLKQTTDSRIFQNLSVPEIIRRIFMEYGLLDFRMSLTGDYAERVYCVQYLETDFNFVSRLMEEEGLFYFFTHEDGKHVMVITDNSSEHKPCPYQPVARYQTSLGGSLDANVLTGFVQNQNITPNLYTVNAFNFKTPDTDLKLSAPGQKGYAEHQLEIYDHHQEEYEKPGEGDRFSHLRMQANEAAVVTFSGTGNCRAFAAGFRFTLTDHMRNDLCNKDYVLTRIKHIAHEGGSYTTAWDQEELIYENEFEAIPFDVTYRTIPTTPKPCVHGSQTAIVTGPPGEEIYTDEYGRVKVQFHWDREGKRDDHTSCWIRVSQVWAGAGWGAMYIPRIGHEVIVDFLEGDPDQPIVVGRVYHNGNMPPYDLPGEKTKSTIKSNSTIGGGGSNEFRFEDKKGSEEVYLHGQKDWTIMIENDKNQTIGHDETLHVKNNRTKNVDVDQKETIGNNKTINVGVKHTEQIGADMEQTVGANKRVTVSQNYSEQVGACKDVVVASNMNMKIGKTLKINTSKDMNVQVNKNKFETVSLASAETVGLGKALSVGGALQTTVGGAMNTSVGLASAEEVGLIKKIIAGDKIELVCGACKLTLDSSGKATFEGTEFEFTASGPIKINGKTVDVN